MANLSSAALARSAQLYDRVKRVIPPPEWATFADDVDAILELKRTRNAVILAHNYQTPEIFHGVADIVGDSLAAGARSDQGRRRHHRARRRALHGRDGQAAQSGKDGADPRPRGRLFARGLDHRAGCAADAPALSRRAGRHLRQHVGRGEGRIRHLLHVGQCAQGRRSRSASSASSCCRTNIWRRTSPRRPT